MLANVLPRSRATAINHLVNFRRFDHLETRIHCAIIHLPGVEFAPPYISVPAHRMWVSGYSGKFTVNCLGLRGYGPIVENRLQVVQGLSS